MIKHAPNSTPKNPEDKAALPTPVKADQGKSGHAPKVPPSVPFKAPSPGNKGR